MQGKEPHLAESERFALAAGPIKLAEIIEQAYAILDARLRDHASDHDGAIQVRDLTAIRQTVTPEHNPALAALVTDAWSAMADLHEQQFWAKQRKFPLERLIVHRFDGVLAPRGTPAVQRETLSRRCIPAFLYALLQMVGEELFEDYSTRCHALIDEAKETEGETVDWESLYVNPSARVLVTDILVFIARYFDDMQKRRQWMMDVFERAMPPDMDGRESGWKFGPVEFHLLFEALYKDLAETLADKTTRESLKKRYGVPNLRVVIQLLENLKIDRKSVDATLRSHYVL